MSTKYVFNPFTGKLDVTDNIASTAITSLTGDVTATGPGAAAATIANDAVTFAKMQNISTDTLIGRDTAGTGDPEEITVTGGLEFTGAGGIQRSALTGDVTATAGSNATTIANNAVTNAKLADMATQTFKGRTTAGTGDPEDLTATQATAMLNQFVGDTGAGGLKGLVTAPATGDAGKFLRGDGTWVTVSASASYTVVTKTTTYTAVANDYILASAASSWTLTLPTAVGISGQSIVLERTDDAPTNVVTVNTTSSQTIGPYASGAVFAVTKNETWHFVSDGANWRIESHKWGTERLGSAAITFSSTGGTQAAAGTTSTNNISYERNGRFARVFVEFVQNAAGTTGQGATLITLPAALVADTTIIPINTNTTFPSAVVGGNVMGAVWTYNGSNVAHYTPALHSSTKLHFGGIGNSAGGLVWGDGGTASMGLGNTTLHAYGWVDIPISGWNP